MLLLPFWWNKRRRGGGRGGEDLEDQEGEPWENLSVQDILNEDFDFDGNLALFDKAKVFAEIKVK